MSAPKILRSSEPARAAIGQATDERRWRTGKRRAGYSVAREGEVAVQRRSRLPRRLAVQAITDLGGWLGWRIEQCQKPRMRSVVEEEGTLVEDRILRTTACALQHELRKFLASQRRRAIEYGLCLRGSADLDDIVFASCRCGHGSAQKTRSVSMAVLTLSIQSRS